MNKSLLFLGLLIALFALGYHHLNARGFFLRTSPEIRISSLSPQNLENLPAASRMALGEKLDLNQATCQELEILPGIGKKMAEHIVEDRQKKGPFLKSEELMRVKGIKQKKFEKLKKYIQVKN